MWFPRMVPISPARLCYAARTAAHASSSGAALPVFGQLAHGSRGAAGHHAHSGGGLTQTEEGAIVKQHHQLGFYLALGASSTAEQPPRGTLPPALAGSTSLRQSHQIWHFHLL